MGPKQMYSTSIHNGSAHAAGLDEQLPVLQPRGEASDSPIADFAAWVGTRLGESFDDYRQLWEWSVDDLSVFWDAIWTYFDVQGRRPDPRVLVDETMPGATWFPDTELNFAENVFQGRETTRTALIEVNETGAVRECTWHELQDRTAAFAEYLRGVGIRPGDRVVAYMPSCIEAVIAFLACASVGAIWSVCNFDLAVDTVIDRFSQLEPAVLLATHKAVFGGVVRDHRADADAVRAALPSLRAAVVVASDDLPTQRAADEWVRWEDTVSEHAPLRFTPLPFAHPLWVLFSSGTTGRPKGIVHGHGGVLLTMKACLAFHLDVRDGDKILWHTSTSWVMWNVLVSALLVGGCVVLYNGSPTHPHLARLWQIAAEHRIDILGMGAAYLIACERAGWRPRHVYPLTGLRMIGSTGSVLPPSTYQWALDAVGDVPVNSISGGTDVAAAFIGWNPMLPVYAGEISGPCLGVAAAAWSDDGTPVIDEPGELVITKPMPSMPTQFWNDPDGTRYQAAYFERYPGVWCHGDLITITSRGTYIIHGRSDATLNRQGVRLGSAEVYRALDSVSEVVDSIAVGVELPDGEYWMPLFVQLVDDCELDDGLCAHIANVIRSHASVRHVPDEIVRVPGIPHTVTGKRLEVPIKKILLGAEPTDILNLGAIDDPALLQPFVEIARTCAATKRFGMRPERRDCGHTRSKPETKTL